MGTLIMIALGIGLLAGIYGGITGMFGGSTGSAGVGFFGAGVAGFILAIIGIFMFTPTFAHWTDGGFFMATLIVLICGAVAGNLGSELSGGSMASGIIGFLAFMVVYLVMPPMVAGPPNCNADANYAVIELLDPNAAVAEPGRIPVLALGQLPPVSPSEIINVSPHISTRKAQSVTFPPELSQLTTYMTVNANGYEQEINGRSYNVHHLDVTGRWGDYLRFGGGKTPGFVMVDLASGEASAARWMSVPQGQELKYVPSASLNSGLDSDWRVYLDYELPNGVQVWEWDGMEVDDNLKPWYIGSVMKPSQAGGIKQWYPVGVVLMDPVTGEFTTHALNELPEWVDRAIPLQTAKQLVEWYFKYSPDHPLCNGTSSTVGQLDFDTEPVVYNRGGTSYAQFIGTNINDSDLNARKLVEVNLRTGEAVEYPLTGIVPSEIEDDIEKQLRGSNQAAPYDAVEPQLRVLNGKGAWVYLVEFNGRFWGYAGVQPSLTPFQNSGDTLIATSIDEFAAKLTAQDAEAIAAQRNSGDVSASGGGQVTLENVRVDRMSAPTNDGSGVEYIYFVVAVLDSEGEVDKHHQLKVRATDSSALQMQEGDDVTVVFTDDGQEWKEIVSITNHTFELQSLLPRP